MGIYSNYVVENNAAVFATNKINDIINEELIGKYLDECFLVLESSASNGIKELTNRIKILTNKMKEEKLSDDEIKEEIQNIYDQAQLILGGATVDKFSKVGLFFSLTGLISATVSWILVSCEIIPIIGLVYTGISLLVLCAGLIIGSKAEYDKFYTILVRAESDMMRELRIARQENDDKKVKCCEKVIEVYEELKAKRRTELNQRAHDYYNESSDVLLEYMGNEIKTNDMIQTFADIEHFLKYEMETLNVYVDHVKTMISLGNSANKKNISEITKKCVDDGNSINDDTNKVRDTWYPMTDAMFRKQIKVFSNKYSKLGMEQREKFSKKMEGYIDTINKILEEFDKDGDIKKSVDELDNKLKSIDYANGEKIIDLIYNWANDGVIAQSNYIIKLCAYIIESLNIKGIKSSLRYKIIGKFGK